MKLALIFVSVLLLTTFGFDQSIKEDQLFLDYTINPKKHHLQFYWRDDTNEPFRNFQSLKGWLDKKGKKLLFATNGGMFKSDHSPVGLYMEAGKMITPLDTTSGEGNFYLKPNGVFYTTTAGDAYISTTDNFRMKSNINYATQSGPMLVINGQIHSAFRKGSTNINIRNGVGILPDGSVLFVMSKKEINFYDFAAYFKNAGCKNALYLDGFVSKTYLPLKNWTETDGDFGVIIAEVESK